MSSRPVDVVRRYLAVVADLASTEADLLAVLHPEVVLIEHPSPIAPNGRNEGIDGIVAGFLSGKDLLAEQAVAVHSTLVEGDDVAVRSTWSGVVAHDTGRLAAGTRLTAHLASFLTVHDGLIARHETYDCYEPFADTSPG